MAPSRRGFLGTASVAGGAALLAARLPATAAAPAVAAFDRLAFEQRARLPFAHRQVFGSGAVADGAVFGFMANSLDAYERGFGEGPGTLHAAAVLYRTAVVLALDDAAWQTFGIADMVRAQADRTSARPGAGNPYLRTERGRAIPDLQRRNASIFVCQNALDDFTHRASSAPDAMRAHLIPGAFVVPAGVAAINALQEEHFTLFVATQ